MEDSDDNSDNMDKLNLEDFEKYEDSIVGSNIDQDNNILEKARITASSRGNDIQLMNRFTVVENNFSEEPNDEKEESDNNSKTKDNKNIDNNPIIEEDNKNKYDDKTKNKSEITFINFKIILVGDVSVGKTSIIGRYINNSFDDDYQCTIQAEQQSKVIKEDENTSIKLNIWDTVGQEKFRAVTRQYYRDCHGAIIVFDLTKKKSFEQMTEWLNDIKNYGNSDTVIIIMGNKSDLNSEREIFPNEIKEKLDQFNDDYLYFEVSAKNGNNISMAFDKLKKLIMENRKNIENMNINEVKNKKDKKDKNDKKEKNDKKDKKEKSNKNKKEEKRAKSLNEFDKNFHEKNKRCC